MAGASEIKASQASHQSCIFWLAYIGNMKISLTRFVNFLVDLKVAKSKDGLYLYISLRCEGHTLNYNNAIQGCLKKKPDYLVTSIKRVGR